MTVKQRKVDMTAEDRKIIQRFETKIDTIVAGLGEMKSEIGILRIRVMGNGDEENSLMGRAKKTDVRLEEIERAGFVTKEALREHDDTAVTKHRNTWLVVKDVILVVLAAAVFFFGKGII